MERRDLIRATDEEQAEADAQAAIERAARERKTMSAKEFVSDRDALEDAWRGSGEHSTRDEGW